MLGQTFQDGEKMCPKSKMQVADCGEPLTYKGYSVNRMPMNRVGAFWFKRYIK